MDQTYRRNLAISLGGASSPVLRRGASGDQVAELQAFLAQQGYDIGPVDGKFGRKTEDAVREFQMVTGVSVDGRVGDETRGAMDRVANAPIPEMRPDDPEPVEEVASADMVPDNGGMEPQGYAPSFDDQTFTEAKPDLGAQYGEAERSDGLASMIDSARTSLTGIPKEKLAAYRRILQPDDWAARPGDGQDALREALLRSIMNQQGTSVAGGY
jgi:peptidoglycan hydrolase-like protein with peptidoglycan-binding domain